MQMPVYGTFRSIYCPTNCPYALLAFIDESRNFPAGCSDGFGRCVFFHSPILHGLGNYGVCAVNFFICPTLDTVFPEGMQALLNSIIRIKRLT